MLFTFALFPTRSSIDNCWSMGSIFRKEQRSCKNVKKQTKMPPAHPHTPYSWLELAVASLSSRPGAPAHCQCCVFWTPRAPGYGLPLSVPSFQSADHFVSSPIETLDDFNIVSDKAFILRYFLVCWQKKCSFHPQEKSLRGFYSKINQVCLLSKDGYHQFLFPVVEAESFFPSLSCPVKLSFTTQSFPSDFWELSVLSFKQTSTLPTTLCSPFSSLFSAKLFKRFVHFHTLHLYTFNIFNNLLWSRSVWVLNALLYRYLSSSMTANC